MLIQVDYFNGCRINIIGAGCYNARTFNNLGYAH